VLTLESHVFSSSNRRAEALLKTCPWGFHENNDPQIIQKNTEWWHRMRRERYGISG